MTAKISRTKRISNFELLRVLAMMMIIAYHYVVHSQAEVIENGSLYQKTFLECFSMFGKVGVNIFGSSLGCVV